jgi:hypothetical protein
LTIRTTEELAARPIDDRYLGPQATRYKVLLPDGSWDEIFVRKDELPDDVIAKKGHDPELCLFELG